jgi:hypothetical protein
MFSLHRFNQTRKRLKQKATLGSLLVVIIIFGLFFEAYMHNFNLVYILLFFIFSFALIASPLGIMNFSGLNLKLERTDRLFAKERSLAYFSLYADKISDSYALSFHCDVSNTFIPSLSAGETKILSIPLIPSSRGMFEIQGCSLESLFPLATIRFVQKFPDRFQTVVYPQPKGISLEAFLRRQQSRFGEESDFEGITVHSGMIHLSKIHWPSVAKGITAIKKFTYEVPLEHLFFDFWGSGSNDEERLSQLTLWVLACEKQHLPFKIQMPGEVLDAKRSSIDEILGKLAAY